MDYLKQVTYLPYFAGNVTQWVAMDSKLAVMVTANEWSYTNPNK